MVFCLILFLYLHIYYHLKTSDDLEVYTLKSPSKDKLEEIESNNQVAFRYCNSEGSFESGYPWNPNGAPNNIAGITNRRGNVLGLMPHPERVFHGWQHTDWTSKGINPDGPGDGRPLFESVVDFLCQTN